MLTTSFLPTTVINDGDDTTEQQTTTAAAGISYYKNITTTTTTTPLPTTTMVSSNNVLFLIFVGGPSGRADLQAIQQTWGRTIRHVLIMTNTPHDILPVLDANSNWNWSIYKTSTLDGGGKRNPVESWKDVLQALDNRLNVQDYPPKFIQYIVRTDSDTWWNTQLLYHQLQIAAVNGLHLQELEQPPSHFRIKRRQRQSHTTTLLPSPTTAYLVGQFHPLVDFEWERNVSGVAMNHQQQYKDVVIDNGRNAYLTGGAGVIMTRTAVNQLIQCWKHHNERSDSNNTVTPSSIWTTSNTSRKKGKSDQEDIWSSKMVYECHDVMLWRNDHMYQSGRKFWTVPQTLSIHRVVGDGRNNHVHPRYYERILWVFQILNWLWKWIIRNVLLGMCVMVVGRIMLRRLRLLLRP